uniref:CCAAT/enhancer-binding protein zeta n=1 Tax=Denticeps clupeoides TaxID=299321 RepID=A0AAY4CCF4_9TELE
MAPKGKDRKLKTAAMEEREEELEDGNDDVDEEAEDDVHFNLDDVLLLGGNKADYIMLDGLDDSKEIVDGGKKGAIDDLEDGELEKFITKLGIRALASQQVIAGSDVEEEEESTHAGDKQESKKTKESISKASTNETKLETKKVDGPNKKKSKVTKETPGTSSSGKKAKQNANLFEFHARTMILVKPEGKWFDQEYTSEAETSPQDESLISQYKGLAQKLYENETGLYKSKKKLQKGANSAWMKTVVSTGTLADRMAAMTVLIQGAPIHCLQHLENLVLLIKKKGGRRQSLMALDTLRELLLSDLLPENRKLRSFSQRPFDHLEERASGNRDVRDRRLILWYFEHQLKNLVAEFVVALDGLAHDTVLATKMRALTTAHELLCNRPEQERALLIQVVNKLGDPDYKVASKSSYLLETLLHKHPNMKAVVCCEVERLMFRPNISSKCQYYAVCFLNQVLLSLEEADLASKLITIYFSFFRACVKKKDVESKMLSALLTGVNRAYPYAKAGDEKVKEQMDTLFKVVHLVKFNTAVQALMLLFQVMDSQQTVSDRYYVALYRKLLDPGLSVCSRQNMFLNLLYKSLKSDIVLRRVKAFVKRLLQVSCDQNPTFVCGALFLVSEVTKAKPGLKLLLQEEGDGEEEKFEDLHADEDEDEEEKFVDADKVEEGVLDKPAPLKPTPSWVHHQNLEGGKTTETYDPLHRNPLFCGADFTSLWELQKLSVHYHPSVSLFARTILQGEFIQYTGDPLQDFTLMRFLDRFVFRNPKQLKGKQNTEATAMQPKQKVYTSNIRSLPVNCEEFLAKEESQIPVDEVFFHRFFKKRATEKLQKRPRPDGDNDSVEDVEDDEFERVLGNNVKSKSKSKKGEESDSEDNLDDEEVSLGSMDEEDFGDELEEEGGAFMDLGGDENVCDDDDDDDEAGNFLVLGSKKGKRNSSDMVVLLRFLPPFQFGCILDENVGSKFDYVSMNAMANKDKADVKQLKWEAQRDDWIRGRDVKSLRKKKAMFKKRKMFGKPWSGKRK